MCGFADCARLRRPRPRKEEEEKEAKEELSGGALGAHPGSSRRTAGDEDSSAARCHKKRRLKGRVGQVNPQAVRTGAESGNLEGCVVDGLFESAGIESSQAMVLPQTDPFLPWSSPLILVMVRHGDQGTSWHPTPISTAPGSVARLGHLRAGLDPKRPQAWPGIPSEVTAHPRIPLAHPNIGPPCGLAR